jgi:hypothetical protein
MDAILRIKRRWDGCSSFGDRIPAMMSKIPKEI